MVAADYKKAGTTSLALGTAFYASHCVAENLRERRLGFADVKSLSAAETVEAAAAAAASIIQFSAAMLTAACSSSMLMLYCCYNSLSSTTANACKFSKKDA